jgi:hypothetical protein
MVDGKDKGPLPVGTRCIECRVSDIMCGLLRGTTRPGAVTPIYSFRVVLMVTIRSIALKRSMSRGFC